MKDSFLMSRDFLDPIEKLTDEQAGALIKKVMRYALDGEDPKIEDQAVEVMFMVMKGQIDRFSEKYDAICKKRSEAGKKGGRPKAKASEKKQKKQKVFDESKKSYPDPDPDPDPDIYTDKSVIDAFEEFAAMRKKIKKPLTESITKRIKKRLDQLSGGDTEKAVKILNQSTDSYWQDVFPLKEDKNRKAEGFSTERDYDREAYNKQFFATGWNEEAI